MSKRGEVLSQLQGGGTRSFLTAAHLLIRLEAFCGRTLVLAFFFLEPLAAASPGPLLRFSDPS